MTNNAQVFIVIAVVMFVIFLFLVICALCIQHRRRAAAARRNAWISTVFYQSQNTQTVIIQQSMTPILLDSKPQDHPPSGE